MTSGPLITVLMPCYNAMPFLTEALDSIINQTYENLEILCINDGSTDNTGDILEEYASRDSRIKVIHNESNLKLIRSLNKGIDLANGRYIARMDSDDISALNRIEIEFNYLEKNPVIDIVSTGSNNMTEEGVVFSQNIPRQFSSKACFFASFFFVPIGHPELLIRTEVLKENKFLFEEHVLHTEDYELWSRLLRKGYNLTNIPDCLHDFRINSQSVSRKYTDIQDQNFIECAKRHYQLYTGENLDTEVAQIMVNRITDAPNLKNIQTAINKIHRLKLDFISKEKIENKTILKEIETVYKTHLLDIFVQTFKRSSFKIKLYAIYQVLLNGSMFFNSSVRIYIKTKIHR